MACAVGLTMFIGANMRFIKFLFFGVIFISFLLGEGPFVIKGPSDLNKNGRTESFLLNDGDKSIKWVELEQSSKKNELWGYNLLNGENFLDLQIIDVNQDGFYDIVALLDISLSILEKEWLYVFLGNGEGFSLNPLKLGGLKRNENLFRPTNLGLIKGDPNRLIVSLGASIREVMIFELKIIDNILSFSNVEFLSEPNTNNGYGPFYVGHFVNDGVNYLTLISCEENELKISTFDIEGKYNFINSNIYNINNIKKVIGSGIEQVSIKSYKQKGVVIPFESDKVLLLTIKEKVPNLFESNVSGESLYPPIYNSNKISISSILKNRFDIDFLNNSKIIPHSIYNKMEKGILLPPLSSSKNSVLVNNYPKENPTSLPNENTKINYNSLNPTLGDFLKTVKDNTPVSESDSKKIDIPFVDNDMESMAWADEAGFTKIDLDKYIIEKEVKADSLALDIPNIDDRMDITKISNESWKENSRQNIKDSINIDFKDDNQIDLYYVLAITPSNEKRDRFIFDGEIPFGVSVNQIPPTGKPTHFKHGISADLKGLKKGNEYDFAYSLRNAQKDSITTLKMVHDMQTNLIYMKRSVLLNGFESDIADSNSKSYQPEAFDPKLFEFPNYFFEGFPSSLDMDFTEKLIRFSFNDESDSIYNGIYLSSTTPSDPSQSLAVFMEEGKLQAIRGEVEVYPNGNKRITTEFDLVGIVEPKVLFSHLIEEKFSEELKMKLLQGASLEEPLFGPAGKLPKIIREPRLPEAQPDQPEFEIPINPKQSNIPLPVENETSNNIDLNKKSKKSIKDSSKLKIIIEPSVPSDSLKLESIKIPSEDGSIEIETIKEI